MVSSETQERIAELRIKSRENTLTIEEMREAIALMRVDRVHAEAVSKTSRAKKGPVNSDDLLSELGQLPE